MRLTDVRQRVGEKLSEFATQAVGRRSRTPLACGCFFAGRIVRRNRSRARSRFSALRKEPEGREGDGAPRRMILEA